MLFRKPWLDRTSHRGIWQETGIPAYDGLACGEQWVNLDEVDYRTRGSSIFLLCWSKLERYSKGFPSCHTLFPFVLPRGLFKSNSLWLCLWFSFSNFIWIPIIRSIYVKLSDTPGRRNNIFRLPTFRTLLTGLFVVVRVFFSHRMTYNCLHFSQMRIISS